MSEFDCISLFIACNVATFPLPSGSLYCRVRNTFFASFDDANVYCKSSGFTGLAEARTKADGVRIAGINVCEYPITLSRGPKSENNYDNVSDTLCPQGQTLMERIQQVVLGYPPDALI